MKKMRKAAFSWTLGLGLLALIVGSCTVVEKTSEEGESGAAGRPTPVEEGGAPSGGVPGGGTAGRSSGGAGGSAGEESGGGEGGALPEGGASGSPSAGEAGEGGGAVEPPVGADDVVEDLGLPALFSVECARHAFDVATGAWEPQAGFVRSEVWIYPLGAQAEVVTLVNGEVVDHRTVDADYSEYPSAEFDPRTFGCTEPEATVTAVIGEPPSVTTAGTDTEPGLDLGSVQLLVNHYPLGPGVSGLKVVFANGLLIGMASL